MKKPPIPFYKLLVALFAVLLSAYLFFDSLYSLSSKISSDRTSFQFFHFLSFACVFYTFFAFAALDSIIRKMAEIISLDQLKNNSKNSSDEYHE